MKQYQIDRIKDLMDAKGVTLKELAFKCGVSEQIPFAMDFLYE